VRNPEDAMSDAAVARISARRVGESVVPLARNDSAFAMISGVRIRTAAAWRTCAFVLSCRTKSLLEAIRPGPTNALHKAVKAHSRAPGHPSGHAQRPRRPAAVGRVGRCGPHGGGPPAAGNPERKFAGFRAVFGSLLRVAGAG